MLGRIVKRNRLIEMRSPFRDIPGIQQESAHEAMPDHERKQRFLLLRERQEVRRKVANYVAIERHESCDAETIENRKHQQRVFGRFARASACSINRRASSTAAFVSGAAYPLT